MNCDVGEVTESLENHNELWRRWSYWVHSPSVQPLHLRHSLFSNPSYALPTSQLILQPFRCFTYATAHSQTILSPSYVTGFSLTSPGEPPMHFSRSWLFGAVAPRIYLFGCTVVQPGEKPWQKCAYYRVSQWKRVYPRVWCYNSQNRPAASHYPGTFSCLDICSITIIKLWELIWQFQYLEKHSASVPYSRDGLNTQKTITRVLTVLLKALLLV